MSSRVEDFDDVLRRVAEDIPDDASIERLGKVLGFNVPVIQRYKDTNMRFQNKTCDGTLKMLRDWQMNQREADERSNLTKALEDAGLTKIAGKVPPQQGGSGQGQAQPSPQAMSAQTTSGGQASNSPPSRVVTEKELNKLAGVLHSDYFIPVAVELGLEYPEYGNINDSNQRSKTFKMFQIWKTKQGGGQMNDLDAALNEAGCGALIEKYKSTGAKTSQPSPYGGSGAAVSNTRSGGERVTDDFLNEIVKDLPNANYPQICEKLGWGHNRSNNELVKFNNDYTRAYRMVFQDWKNRTGGTVAQLTQLVSAAGYSM